MEIIIFLERWSYYQTERGNNKKMQKLIQKNIHYKKYRNVRDHCHYAGKYKGAAYSICNLRYSIR